jgi:hypothetical protein
MWPQSGLYQEVSGCIGIFTGKTSSLTMVKVALRFNPGNIVPDGFEYADFTRSGYLPQPLSIVGGLPLLHRVEAYRLYHHLVYSSNFGKYNLLQSVTKVGCYLYASEHNTARYWNAEEILEEWPDTKTEAPAPDVDVDYVFLDESPHMFGGWKEKRGHDEAIAWV